MAPAEVQEADRVQRAEPERGPDALPERQLHVLLEVRVQEHGVVREGPVLLLEVREEAGPIPNHHLAVEFMKGCFYCY